MLYLNTEEVQDWKKKKFEDLKDLLVFLDFIIL
jgi:hypothetical protein